MKVHRKLLVHYLSSPSPVDKEGFLFKKKQRTGTFHRRWFVLKGNLLFYQERPADRHIGGAIVLEGCAVRTEDSDLDFSLVFEGLRTYRFCVGERWRRDEWVKCLLTASHCYMSLLLRDLGLQYHALQSCGSPHTSFKMTSDLVLAPPSDPGSRAHNPAPHQATPPCAPATKATPRKSPNVWARRNAHVTPMNGPGPLWSEWPAVDFNPLQEFKKIHEYYGREVQRARDEWRGTRARDEGRGTRARDEWRGTRARDEGRGTRVEPEEPEGREEPEEPEEEGASEEDEDRDLIDLL